MIKKLIYRFIKFLFGVSIEDLIARNKSLESDFGATEKENSQLKQQIELQEKQLVENEEMLLALRNEVEILNQEKKAIILRFILTDGKDDYYQKKLEDTKWIAKRDEIKKKR